MTSVWVYEKTWPTCSEPLTVGGGVSIEKTSARVARAIEAVDAGLLPSVEPTSLRGLRAPACRVRRSGVSGPRPSDITRSYRELAVGPLDPIDLFAHETLGDVDHGLPHVLVLKPIDHAADDIVDDLRSRSAPGRRGPSHGSWLARRRDRLTVFGGQQGGKCFGKRDRRGGCCGRRRRPPRDFGCGGRRRHRRSARRGCGGARRPVSAPAALDRDVHGQGRRRREAGRSRNGDRHGLVCRGPACVTRQVRIPAGKVLGGRGLRGRRRGWRAGTTAAAGRTGAACPPSVANAASSRSK